MDKEYFLLDKHPDLSLYLKNIKEIKELLITIRKLKNTKEDKKIIEKYYVQLFNTFNKKFSNCSELGCFVNACDTTRDLVQKDFKTFKIITDFYLAKRDVDDKVPANWVQAILDSNSSRRKGDLGERKLINILKKSGFQEVFNWVDFQKKDKIVAVFSDTVFSLEQIRQNLKINLETKKQEKKLDLLIKYSNGIFLLEAKHSNVGGGEQNKQVSELIEIMSLKEGGKDIFYVAFLDGTHSNVVLGNVSERAVRIKQQQKEILQYLQQNPNSFWLNTAGFKALFKDIIQ
ncbi:MAG: hypothetical protein PHY72_00470 [Candidatus Pacebacteria bacterium]|nr:hypothetical protein [Candidatus Paceibacterota bacterium]